jgi:tRNA (guanine37-N1)-methyltransferase
VSDLPRLRFDLFSVFPAMFSGPLDQSIIKRARDNRIIEVQIHDIRDWTSDRHRTTDDTPYGGGAGMVMMAPPIIDAVEETLGESLASDSTRVIVLSAAGRLFNQSIASELAAAQRLVCICGHYEGIDERVTTLLHADELSIGDYVLTGGELAAMIIVDAVARLVPGVIAHASVDEESHRESLVEYPQYTRPAEVRGVAVPDVLLSGHHAQIARWRREQAIARTAQRRPELLASANLSDVEWRLAESMKLAGHHPERLGDESISREE